ncbi:MAG: SAP domain-containing protein [Lentisphaeria bacterium]|nr:SAP domain-containing protein [Lentisphaeria bacterium]
MKMIDVREKAKKMGLKANGGKAAVITRIQEAEGNEPCFGTRTTCPQMNCCWREDCIK